MFTTIDVRQFERPLEDALQELDTVLDIIYPAIRASERKIIGNIESVKGRNIISSTRSEGVIDSLIPETAYYFINFENDGFAVLGADTRLEGVYIVAEQGTISSGIFTYSSGDDSDEFEGVDEADLYDPEEDDYMINGDCDIVIGNMLATQVAIATYPTLNLATGEPAPTYGPQTLYKEEKSQVKVGPLLTTKWYQREPFNKYAENSKKKKAGCVMVALGQIIAYHEYPNPINARPGTSGRNGSPIVDCTVMKEAYGFDANGNFQYGSSTAQEQVALFMRFLALSCNATYYPKSTFAWPKNAKTALKDLGYPDVKLYKRDVDENTFKKMLNNKCPIFYSSYPKGNFTAAHAWVIDGYLYYKTTYYYKQLIDNSYYRYWEESIYTSKLYHCNFGWKGNGDGYYSLSLLDPTKGGVIRDPIDIVGNSTSSDEKKDGQYTQHIRWIYYTKPNK